MRRVAIGAAAALACVCAGAAWAAPPVDPHAPELEAAARAALPRARVLPLQARTSPLKGFASATSGRVEAIRDLASELRASGLIVTATERGLRVTLPENVLFDFDRSALRPDAGARLEVLSRGVAKVPDLPVRVEGHTDAKGAADYNRRLSSARAETVRAWLAGHGVAGGRLSAAGFGAERPVAPNTTPDGRDDPAGRQRNRRVEVVIGG